MLVAYPLAVAIALSVPELETVIGPVYSVEEGVGVEPSVV
jgi:hypothetical protein